MGLRFAWNAAVQLQSATHHQTDMSRMAQHWSIRPNTYYHSTRWANQYLAKRSLAIEDLSTDLKSGLILANLLEVISDGESVGRINRNPKMEIQMYENLNLCLKFLKDHDINLVNIGSQDIYKSNEKLILGLLWTIILRYEVSDADGKQGLLLWVGDAWRAPLLYIFRVKRQLLLSRWFVLQWFHA
jgi:hypothetical protein